VTGPADTVLVVDDDSALRKLACMNLELDGYSAPEAGSLQEARDALEGGRIDVVLLDVHLGAENGLELLATVKTLRPRPAVALLTGTSNVTKGVNPSVDAVIPKPFGLDAFRETVAGLVELARLRRATARV
jgi:two-component system OmpR family response regulator